MKVFESPITVNFEITRNCNASCKFCYIKENNQTFSPIHRIKNLIDIFKEAGILRINLFGGEPFLYPQIDEIIDYIYEKEFYLSAVTNGLSITPALVDKIKNKINVVGVSLHGLKNEHEKILQTNINNSFEKVIDSMRLLSSAGIHVGINMTITSENYNKISEVVGFLKNDALVDIKFFVLNRYIPGGEDDKSLAPNPEQLLFTLKELERISAIYKDIIFRYAISFPHCSVASKELKGFIGRCGFGQSYCAVDELGNFKTCSYTPNILGNVFETPLKNIWKEHSILRDYRDEKWVPLKCQKCNSYENCMVGCKASSGIHPFHPDIMIGGNL